MLGNDVCWGFLLAKRINNIFLPIANGKERIISVYAELVVKLILNQKLLGKRFGVS